MKNIVEKQRNVLSSDLYRLLGIFPDSQWIHNDA